MTVWSEWPQSARDAVLRIQSAIEAEEESLGPQSEFARLQAEDDPDELPRNAMLSEWVVVAAYTDMETGECWRVRWVSPNLPTHHSNGLLRTFTE